MIHIIFNLIRPLNVFIGICSVLIIFNSFSFNKTLFLTLIVVGCFIASSNIINDLFDQKTDKMNNRQKIYSDQIIYIYISLILLLIIGVLASLQLNINSQIISLLIVLPLIFLYTPILKGIPFLGNFIVSLLVALVFVYAEVSIFENIKISILPFFLSLFLMLIREIIKDIEDIKGDTISQIRTMPVLVGRKFSIKVSIFLMLSFNILLIALYFSHFSNYKYLLAINLGVILPNSYCIYYLFTNQIKSNFRYVQKIQKITIIMGLITLIIIRNNL